MEEIDREEFLEVQCCVSTVVLYNSSVMIYIDNAYFSIWDTGMFRYFKSPYGNRKDLITIKKRLEKLIPLL
jgi:hypothetical protein